MWRAPPGLCVFRVKFRLPQLALKIFPKFQSIGGSPTNQPSETSTPDSRVLNRDVLSKKSCEQNLSQDQLKSHVPDYVFAALASAPVTGSSKESTKLASPFNGMNLYVSCTPVDGTELGPVWDVTMASVENVL